MNTIGLHFCLPLWRIILPVGISFYTFQVISYVVDVYRGRLPACRDVVAFAVFVSFFPQLVAGPIERASHLLPQIQAPRHLSYADTAGALRQILWGFAKKMLVADRCAPLINDIFANPTADGTDLWMSTVLFAFQIYGDFSGYSDIAVGTARLFGIRLSRNFNIPYLARNVAEFWRRWHTTLMAWLRDYLYIPLGGSRHGIPRTLSNTGIVFLASGLWHGANLMFVVWGLYHAAWFIPLVLLERTRTTDASGDKRKFPSLREILQMSATFLIVCVGWVFFRSETLAAAADHLVRMFSDIRCHTPHGGTLALLPPYC